MSENDNNFETLRRLLALKQHEVPPPGYFEGFSGMVIARIRAGETGDPLPWLLRFLQAFEARPALPVALASGMCMMLLYGIVSVEQNPGVSSVLSESTQGASVFPVATTTPQMNSSGPLYAIASDTNSPIDLSSSPSLFGSSNPYLHQVGFVTGGN